MGSNSTKLTDIKMECSVTDRSQASLIYIHVVRIFPFSNFASSTAKYVKQSNLYIYTQSSYFIQIIIPFVNRTLKNLKKHP